MNVKQDDATSPDSEASRAAAPAASEGDEAPAKPVRRRRAVKTAAQAPAEGSATEGSAPEAPVAPAAQAPAKPARRKRAAPAQTPAAEAPEGAAQAAPGAEPAAPRDAQADSRDAQAARREEPAAPREDQAATREPQTAPGEEPAPARAQAPARRATEPSPDAQAPAWRASEAPPVAPEPSARVAQAGAPAPQAVVVPAPTAYVAATVESVAPAIHEPIPSHVTPVAEAAAQAAGTATEGETADGTRAERSRRRNRRDRRRGREGAPLAPEAEGVAAEEAAEDDEVEAAVVEPLPPTDPGEVFAEVVSGAFDAAEPEAGAEAPAVPPPHKRVLRADADAPKLHKVLAQAGIGSRRDMEQLIMDGKITVNGQPAHIGQRISFGDHIKVDGRPVKVRIVPPAPRIVAYHKPVGEVVTHDDPQHRPTVFRRLPRLAQGKWQSVGRLDINTEGLLLFTNSGELANQLMHPRFGVEREYAVRVLGTLDDEAKAELLEGVDVDGQAASFKSIEDGGGEGANHWYRVVIAEGRNREVRKLFDAVGLTVSRLIRIRYGTVVLPRGLKRGVWVDLGDDDVRAIRRLAGGGEGGAQARDERGGRGARNKKRNRNERQDIGGPRPGPRGGRPPEPAQRADVPRDDDDFEREEEIDHSRIPNPLEQTFDKRFVQNPRTSVGGRGFRSGGGGFGSGGSAPAPKKAGGPKEPDPLQTSVGYIGADAFHRKGGRGGNRGGGGGGAGGGGNRGGGGGFSGFGGNRGGRGR